uniref:Condensation domain-containing protein n=1 Tax=Haemonchus contortus TaxID=6289 RepID=A0A7I5E8X5_HAECO
MKSVFIVIEFYREWKNEVKFSTVSRERFVESASRTEHSRISDLLGQGHVRCVQFGVLQYSNTHSTRHNRDVTIGVHQGSAQSPFPFGLTVNVIAKELINGPLKTIRNADGITSIAESMEEAQNELQKLQNILAENEHPLEVAPRRTESIVNGFGQAMERVLDFRCLCSDQAADDSVDQAMKAGMNAAWTKWREFTCILCSRTFKGRVCRTVVRSKMLYDSKC